MRWKDLSQSLADRVLRSVKRTKRSALETKFWEHTRVYSHESQRKADIRIK